MENQERSSILIVFARPRNVYNGFDTKAWSCLMPNIVSSRLPGFYDLSIEDRRMKLIEVSELTSAQQEAFKSLPGLSIDQANHMIENVIGTFALPFGIAVNFIVNDREVLVPMAIEEPSVVAGASYMAKLARPKGGFRVDSTHPEMIAQIQVLEVPDPDAAEQRLLEHKERLLSAADLVDPVITRLGGGAKDIEIRILDQTPVGSMMIVHLIVDTRDAMGANVVNSMAEALTPIIAELTSGRVHLRILSNLADRRLVHARCTITVDDLAFEQFPGERVRDGIVEAWAFADADPYRAATHNKGIMNGIDAVVIATGNDWRAVEAGAHAFAARNGQYEPLSRWWVSDEGDLEGELQLPLAVGIVGGATHVHPTAQLNLALLGVKTARELAEVIAAVGLAQNLAALRALATEGIQRGHMTLHARQIAIAAGAQGSQIEKVASQLVLEGEITLERAEELIRSLVMDQP
jgi:hydroxymethylglutaryl-CoA reductase